MSGISWSIALYTVIPVKEGIQKASDQSGLASANNLDSRLRWNDECLWFWRNGGVSGETLRMSG